MIGAIHREQRAGDFSVPCETPRLEDRRRIRCQSQPFQTFDDALSGGFRAALAVSILDAKKIFSAMVATEQVIEECRAHAADMQRPGRAGRKAGANCRMFLGHGVPSSIAAHR
jgi:hypothetical protein